MIYNESCLDTLSRMGDNSVDLVLTSPPYNMNLRIRNGKYCSRQIVKEFSTKYEGFADNLPIEDFYEFHSEVLSELLRVGKIVFYNISIVTGSKVAFFKMIGDFAEELKDIVVWDKVNGQPAMKDNVLNRRSEFLLIFGDDAISRRFNKANFDRGTLDDVWQIKRGRVKFKEYHGAVFPNELVDRVLLNFTDEGDLVYDPFGGVGTVPVRCKELGRRYIASELSSSYYNIIKERLK